MKSLFAACAVALALVAGVSAATAQELPAAPTADPADPNALPPEPTIEDPSPAVAVALAKLHALDMERALASAESTFADSQATEDRSRVRRDSTRADRDEKRTLLTGAVTATYVRGDSADNTPLQNASARLLAGHAIDRDLDEVAAAEERLRAAESALSAAVKVREAAQGARDTAQAAFDEAKLAVNDAARLTNRKDVSPSVLGDPVLTAEEIVGWFKQQAIVGYVGRVDIMTMATYYIDEAKAEHVRGDIAFAQSIVETGSFTSPLTTHNNFAGIGACDSCPTGFDFRTPQEGVRAQAQLLHAYADKDLRRSGLANPAVGTNPDELSVRGCCTTWNKLTGTWATDPNYGPKIMTIYLQMLQYAFAERTKPAEVAPPAASVVIPRGLRPVG